MWYEALFLGALMTFVFIPVYGMTVIPLLAGVGVAGGWLWLGKAQPERRRGAPASTFYKFALGVAILVLIYYTSIWIFPVETQLLMSRLGLGR